MELSRLLTTSDRLHERVQCFARGDAAESFEQLALEIAQFQAEASRGFRRLIEARGGKLSQFDEIPPVPADAFRLARVAAHPPELDRVRFTTSGTTGSARGTHAMRRTDTYEQLSLRFGRDALLPANTPPEPGSAVVVALAPPLGSPPSSSLGYMIAEFMAAFDGAPLEQRWLLSDAGVELNGLRRAAAAASTRRLPLLVLGTAFALVRLLDDLAGAPLQLPPDSVVMQTGGFKGRSREVSADDLRAQLSLALGIAPERVVGEYGMTELTSQLYEPTISESKLAQGRSASPSRVYVEPAWLRVTPVDPLSLEPVATGQVGIARFVDLGNVDSAVSVVTQDLVRRVEGGIELLGREPGAPARGCSLAVEALLG